MEKMISYVFGSMEIHERAIGGIVDTLKKQEAFNKRVALFAMATTACVLVMDIQRKENTKKIEKLTKEVEELKTVKGE